MQYAIGRIGQKEETCEVSVFVFHSLLLPYLSIERSTPVSVHRWTAEYLDSPVTLQISIQMPS